MKVLCKCFLPFPPPKDHNLRNKFNNPEGRKLLNFRGSSLFSGLRGCVCFYVRPPMKGQKLSTKTNRLRGGMVERPSVVNGVPCYVSRRPKLGTRAFVTLLVHANVTVYNSHNFWGGAGNDLWSQQRRMNAGNGSFFANGFGASSSYWTFWCFFSVWGGNEGNI